jgi:sporulation protein YlmC with PRC-barrel domain
MYSRDFLDKEVVGLNGWKIGKSKEIICDINSWRITHIEVELTDKIENEIGETLPLQHNRVPIDISYVQGIGDVITLKTTKEEIIAVLSAYAKSRQSEAPQKGPIVV